jgi:hypothetical protein
VSGLLVRNKLLAGFPGANIIQCCGGVVKRKKVKAKVEAEGMRVMSRE